METAKDTDTVEAFEYGEVSKLDISRPTGDVMLLDAAGHVRRVPMPSSDPNDPMNMHRWRKLGVIVPCCWFSVFSFLVMAFGAAKSTTYQAHMACRILQGVATGATESVLALIITDISFLNERGLLFGAFWGTQNLINAIFTITVGFLVADTNWQYPDEADVPKLSYWQTLQVFYRPAPGALQVGLGTFGKMISAMSSPAVVWAVLATSISLGVGISMTLTYGTILTGDFGWSEASVGLVNCGIFPASLFLMLFAGYLGDKLNLFLAKRHGGTHKPEDSLASFVFPTLVSAIGIIIYALTAQHPETHSYWGIVMGWTLYEFGFIVALITATHFAAEAYPQNPGPALVVVVGLKNVISFGASFGITPMVHKQVFLLFDYLTAYMILFGIFAGIFACGIPVYFLNPKWRELVSQKQQ
ncbi:MFS general substrate transporter [Hortaea werneckii]|nr:MFS general substrate transporter [Hortaea werneckii]